MRAIFLIREQIRRCGRKMRPLRHTEVGRLDVCIPCALLGSVPRIHDLNKELKNVILKSNLDFPVSQVSAWQSPDPHSTAMACHATAFLVY